MEMVIPHLSSRTSRKGRKKFQLERAIDKAIKMRDRMFYLVKCEPKAGSGEDRKLSREAMGK